MAFSISTFGIVDFGGENLLGVSGAPKTFNVSLSPSGSAWEPSCGAAADAMVKVTFVHVFARAGVGHEWSESQST